jgi:hypothetical protein
VFRNIGRPTDDITTVLSSLPHFCVIVSKITRLEKFYLALRHILLIIKRIAHNKVELSFIKIFYQKPKGNVFA